jgi:hypothetical protein
MAEALFYSVFHASSISATLAQTNQSQRNNGGEADGSL